MRHQASRPLEADEMVDAAILARTAAGDLDALERIYLAHYQAVRKTAYRLVLNVEDAEDITHDVFLSLPELLRRYEDRGLFAGWLRSVAARRALMHLRARANRRSEALSLEHEQYTLTSESCAEDLIDLERAIRAVPQSLRVVLILRHLEGFSHGEIATMLEITPGASRARLARALEQVRHHIDKDSSR